MITVGYSTRKSNPEFIEYLIKSSGFKKIKVIEKINNGEKSLCEVYNEILNESETDIVVLCHDDIYFDTNSWYSKLIKHFEKTDFGILGVAGTTSIPKSGMWWEDRSKMVGIVNHESNGKKWESKYSESLGNSINETIIVDGLFIALNKKRIKHKFNEEFKGFHFYDVSFCLENYIQGVKIGVISNIRITHKSIGQTNTQWDENRIFFSEKYRENLPIKIPFDENKRLKVLITCLSFKTFTGSEIYVYELAKNLIKQNCDVTVVSNIGGPLTTIAERAGINCVSLSNPPGYKMGDGKWGLNTGNGFELSKDKVLYKIKDVNFDIIHVQHKPITENIIRLYPNIDKIATIHSEVIDLEKPVIHPSIKKYIAIRPEIKEYLISDFDINENDIEVIYNPIDSEKFNTNNIKKGNYVLFVGTIDYLRKDTIFDLIEYTKSNSLELWLIGENKSDYLTNVLENKHVVYHKQTWDLDKFIKNCFEVAGIQLGRTTIEGWMSGKNAWIYNVNQEGEILQKNKFEPPIDIEKYHSKNVSKSIKNLYLNIINNGDSNYIV